MKKSIIACTLALSLVGGMVTGCGSAKDAASADQGVQVSTDEMIEDTEVAYMDEENVSGKVLDNGSPWVNSDLKENIHPDQPTDPKDDFHLYASMNWLSQAQIPAGYSSYTLYDQCADLTKAKAIEMFNEDDFSEAPHNVQLAKRMFDLYKDTDARNQAGVEPIREITDRYLAVESLEDLNALMLDKDIQMLYPTPVALGAGPGLEDTSTYLCWIDGLGFILGDAAEYTDRSEYGDILYNYQKEVFVYIAGRLGMDEAEAVKRFDDAIAFETPIAKNAYTDEEKMAADYFEKVNQNVFTYEEAMAVFEHYPIAEVIDLLGLKYDGKYMTEDLAALKSVDAAYTEDNAQKIANLMFVHCILGSKSLLDDDVRATFTAIYNGYMGVSDEAPLDERAFIWVSDVLPEQTSQAYVERYSSEEDKARIEDVCYQAIDVYKEMLSNNDWASDETKAAAVEKLEAITVHVGWPDEWNDYSDLDISEDSYYDANMKISAFMAEKSLNLLGKQVDKDNWAEGKDLLSCNAFYDLTSNSMVLLAGMMNEPFYWSDMSTEELYASLGAFWIGHELSHAFDSNGAQWDKDGNFSDWWTEDDKAEFDKRVGDFSSYLDTIRIMGDYYVNGSNVDTEMVADTIGLKCALKMAEAEEEFDYKTFFEFFSDMNSSVALYANVLAQINGDPHPLNYLRANVPVQQFEKFYEVYDVKEGDNMYLAPEKRLNLW